MSLLPLHPESCKGSYSVAGAPGSRFPSSACHAVVLLSGISQMLPFPRSLRRTPSHPRPCPFPDSPGRPPGLGPVCPFGGLSIASPASGPEHLVQVCASLPQTLDTCCTSSRNPLAWSRHSVNTGRFTAFGSALTALRDGWIKDSPAAWV